MFIKYSKYALAFWLVLTCLFSLAACGENENEARVFDYADLLTDADEQRINDAANGAGESRFFIATHNATLTNDSLIGVDFLREQGYSTSENIVLLVITLDRGTYYYDLYTYGAAYRRMSDSEAEDILDDADVYSNIKNGRLADGAVAFIGIANDAVALPWVGIVIVSLIAGLVTAGIVCSVMIAKYKMRMRPTNYPLDKYAKLELTESHDSFINSRVSVQIISNGSGGGGRSGGSGHGGGGGHRGGR